MSTVTLIFNENLELKNSYSFMKYLVLLKNNVNDFWKFLVFKSFSFK